MWQTGMVKWSPIEMLHAGNGATGKYLILVGGGTAEVEESYREGMQAAPAEILDEVFLPHVDPRVVEVAGWGENVRQCRIADGAGNVVDCGDYSSDRCGRERRRRLKWRKSEWEAGWVAAAWQC